MSDWLFTTVPKNPVSAVSRVAAAVMSAVKPLILLARSRFFGRFRMLCGRPAGLRLDRRAIGTLSMWSVRR